MSRPYKLFLLLLLLMLVAACRAESEPPTPEPATNTALTYRDASLPITERVELLLAEMTLEEKVGQMTLIEKNSLSPKDVTARFLGGVLSGGGGSPSRNMPEAWREMTRSFQEAALATRLGIPILYGVDAVHGHGNLEDATLFPHNIGLGATRNPDLVREIGRVTALETAVTGVNWNYSPTIAVAQDIRWGRTYESFSENTALVSELGTALMEGFQNGNLAAADTLLATPKHFIADGGAQYGTSTAVIIKEYLVDRGDAVMDEATLRAVHLPPYEAAIAAGARSMMVSFSSWNGVKNHANQELLAGLLKQEMGFDGFLVSDWAALGELADNQYNSVVLGINASIDMVMVPDNFDLFILALTSAVEQGDVSEARIDDAVRRILQVKFELGLFEKPFPADELAVTIGSEAHRDLARQAVRESAVLLTHQNNALPISPDAPLIFLAGEAINDIGLQAGGWTLEWQGKAGNHTAGTSLLNAIQAEVSEETTVQFSRLGQYDRITDDNGEPAIADVGIVALAEPPYAEGEGDSADLSLDNLELVARVAERSEKTIVILFSGRPVIITNELAQADAWIAAWLPGSEAQGLADLLFGQHQFSGQLPFSWPRSVEQLPFDFTNLATEGCDAPLFAFGHGLTTDDEFLPVLQDCS